MSKSVEAVGTALGPGEEISETRPAECKVVKEDAPRPGFEIPSGVEAAPVRLATKPPAKTGKRWTFVKNIHPGEIIRFQDGTSFQFPSVVFVTHDEMLAARLVSVAARHHIVVQ